MTNHKPYDALIVGGGHNGLVCAAYLAAALRGTPLEGHGVVLRTPLDAWPDWFPQRDAELALDIDRFDFALPVARENGLLIARPLRSDSAALIPAN